MTAALGYEFYDFCGGENCSKIIDLANKMIERYKGDRTNLYKEMEEMENEFKDKEEYIDHLRKKRSDLEKEVRFLKDKVESKNEDLVKAHNDVMEAKFKVIEQEEISKKIIAKLKEETQVFAKKVEISNKVIAALNNNPKIKIECGSHTDCRGSKSYNRKLSERRAKSTAKYIQKSISNPERVTYKGYGEDEPAKDNNCSCRKCSSEEHQKNRRSEFLIVK